MIFRLCFKDYKFKPSIKAMKDFKEATGKDLWSSLVAYMGTFTNSRASDDSVADTMAKLAQVLDFTDAAILFYCLAVQENKALQLAEIEDACFHAGILPSQRADDMSEPYPFVLYRLALDVQKYHVEETLDEKKTLAASLLQAES